MTEKKLPQAGEFWGVKGMQRAALRVIGFDDGECVVRKRDGTLSTFNRANWAEDGKDWEHLPWCTSFDDTEPVAEVWPKYFVGNKWGPTDAFVRYDRPDFLGMWVRSDGSESQHHGWYYHDAKREADRVSWREVTESEALARLTPKCPDCGELAGDGHADVCPMAWVTQDLVPPRALIDQVNWSHWKSGHWVTACGVWDPPELHGFAEKDGGTLSVRCRRQNLPPLPDPKPEDPPVTRETVHQWIEEWMAGKQFTLTSSP